MMRSRGGKVCYVKEMLWYDELSVVEGVQGTRMQRVLFLELSV